MNTYFIVPARSPDLSERCYGPSVVFAVFNPRHVYASLAPCMEALVQVPSGLRPDTARYVSYDVVWASEARIRKWAGPDCPICLDGRICDKGEFHPAQVHLLRSLRDLEHEKGRAEFPTVGRTWVDLYPSLQMVAIHVERPAPGSTWVIPDLRLRLLDLDITYHTVSSDEKDSQETVLNAIRRAVDQACDRKFPELLSRIGELEREVKKLKGCSM